MQDSSTSVSVTNEFDEARFMRACGELWSYRALGRLGNYGVAGLVLVCAALLMWQGVPGPVAPVLLLGAAIFVGMDVMRDQLWRRYFRATRKYQGPITATVSNTGVGVSGLEGDHHQPWSHFQSFARTESYIFLLLDQRQFSVIPLDAFTSNEKAFAFETMVAGHLRRLPRRLF